MATRNRFLLFVGWACLTACLAIAGAGTPALAQPPEGYYGGAAGLEGEALREALHRIVRGHSPRTYAQLWQDFTMTDRKDNGMVWDMYSDMPGGTPPYEYVFFTDQCTNTGAEGFCYNREHSFPVSWWGGSRSDTMYTDLFHVHPTDGYVNALRANHPYGEVSHPTETTLNGSRVGPNIYRADKSLSTANYHGVAGNAPARAAGYTGTVFEPIDEYKGDFARNYFYMMVRYLPRVGGWEDNTPMLEGGDLAAWAVPMLTEWHLNDPVSPKEIARNDSVYRLQGNRNPFIDHPEWACLVWGGNCADPLHAAEPGRPGADDPMAHAWISGGSLVVTLHRPPAGPATIEAWDLTGRRLMVQRVDQPGTHRFPIRRQQGIFLIRILAGGQQQVIKLSPASD
jgi:endonuclease I